MCVCVCVNCKEITCECEKIICKMKCYVCVNCVILFIWKTIAVTSVLASGTMWMANLFLSFPERVCSEKSKIGH